MSWKFWQKEKHGENSSGTKEVKLAKPKDLPDRVGMHMVTQLKEDPDWVWNLKCVLRPKADEKHAFEVRVFNPADAVRQSVVVKNFNSLDDHPDMILFFGWFSKDTGIVKIEKRLQKVA
ncbi:MAG: hypothetical protein P8X90_07985 [Desulfobacterales bacterium]|jgi:hypothetical protein